MDVNTTDELRHLLSGPRIDEEPKGFGIAGYRVTCRRDSFDVLECVKETLAFILTCHIGMEAASDLGGKGEDTDDVLYLLREPVLNQLAGWYRQSLA